MLGPTSFVAVNCSFIFLSQEYKAINVAMRKNASGLIVFNSDVALERNAIIDECSALCGKHRFERMWESVCSVKYNFLCIRPIENNLFKKYSRNFEQFIDPFFYNNDKFDISEIYKNKNEVKLGIYNQKQVEEENKSNEILINQ